MEPNKRSFEPVELVSLGGRYIHKTPAGPAKKAFSQLNQELKRQGKSEQNSMPLILRETTRGSKGKAYSYLIPVPQGLVDLLIK